MACTHNGCSYNASIPWHVLPAILHVEYRGAFAKDQANVVASGSRERGTCNLPCSLISAATETVLRVSALNTSRLQKELNKVQVRMRTPPFLRAFPPSTRVRGKRHKNQPWRGRIPTK